MENKKRLKNLYSWFYFDICEEYYCKFMQRENKLSTFRDDELALDLTKETYYIIQERDKFAVISIIFAAMHLEAFIYDYAIINLPKSVVDDHLDKLNVVSKWIIIIQLVTCKKFPRSSNTVRLLKKLVKYRNGLVHSKSKFMDALFNEDALEAYDQERRESAIERYKQVHDAYRAIKQLYELLDELDINADNQSWRHHLKEHKWLI